MFAEIRKEYLSARGAALPFVVCTVGENPHQGLVSRPQGFAHHHMLWVQAGAGINGRHGPFLPPGGSSRL